jgi:hypothetical protein
MRIPAGLLKASAFIIAGALASFLAGCFDFGRNPLPSLRLNDTLTIGYHGTLSNTDEDEWLSFDSLFDGRCPVGMYCYSMGCAAVYMTFGRDNGKYPFTLRITDAGDPLDTVVLDYHFRLVELSPYPGSHPTIVPEEYRAKIVINRFTFRW